MKENKLTELRSISKRLESVTEDYAALFGSWSSESEQQMLHHLQSVNEMLKQQIMYMEEYEKICFDDIIDFT